MKRHTLLPAIIIGLTFGFASCNENSSEETNGTEVSETGNEEENETPEPQHEEEVSPLGNFEALVGTWSVDAATAGLAMTITLNEDGSFSHTMGDIAADGTWEVVDDEHIMIVTPNVENGQKWLVTDLTDASVNICWNPDSADPKTIPFQRAE